MARRFLSENARKFGREVGSIVLGVLIALGIGEVADDWRWQGRAAKSNRAMDIELARAVGVLDERVMVQPCLTRRLDALAAIVRRARQTGTLPDLPAIGGPPLRPMQTSAWDDAVASGTLIHLDPQRLSTLSLNYPMLKDFPADTARELGQWSGLDVLTDVPGPASDALLVDAAKTIATLQWSNRITGITGLQIRDDLLARGIRPSYFLILDREGTRAEIARTVRANPVCRDLAPPAAG